MYWYKGNKYVVSDAKAKMKDSITREWVDAIVYFPIGSSATTYVREKSDFEAKFKKL